MVQVHPPSLSSTKALTKVESFGGQRVQVQEGLLFLHLTSTEARI